ncbi:Vicilin GC72-A [Hibiscus syriacus]|uniref:Vicilin GC72-A n=1 Tax=Hibiscus syriacus TaxID=106335 RepID=A0A6A2WHC1_HIBSY|nr:vicilin C72-like [Hibiscus syriacus]KAE8658343.1 Vicilin GC72-A [Hibiscus syriacus]
MVTSKSFLLVLLFSLVLSFGLLCSAADRSGRRGKEDPRKRYQDCQRRCQGETRGEREQDRCEEQCERQFRQEQREQEEEDERWSHGDPNPEDPQRRFEECRERCQQEGQRQQPQCQQQCQREFQGLQQCQQHCQQEEQRPERKQQCVRQCREKFEEQPRRERGNRREDEEEEEEWEEGRQSHNPYYFPRRKYAQARYEEDNGNFWVLQRFSQKHQLLKGIDEYRVALIEANPNTFVLPHHCDADKIYFVTRGKGTLTFLTQKKKESFNLVPGVIVKIPTGSTVYLVNQDNNEKLIIAVLHRPVNNPGKFEEFFPAGQEQPQSYYQPFSREILEAVFNTRSEQLDRLFQGKQSQQGMFRRVSQEQIKSLSKGATTPKEKEEKCAFNLLSQNPKYSNENGKFFEACPREFELLRNIDAAVAGIEISKGSIFVPHYNSMSTFVVLVTNGNGYVEMVCPHLSSQSSRKEEEEEEEEERKSGEYKQVKTRLSAGDVFVVPAGHPVTYYASQNQHLRFIAFGLYHQNNTRNFIAGKDNMMKQMDSEAKELAFGLPSKFVDEIFSGPKESYFVSRQSQQRGDEESRGKPMNSILDLTRFF